MRFIALGFLCCLLVPAQVPQALRNAVDLGRADADIPLPSLRVTFKLSAGKQAELERLLAAQQDPASPEFHKWLTPETYAHRFGASDADVAEVSNWLRSRGLAVNSIAPSRASISFGGSLRLVERAFDAEIHRYSVRGETHFSNASDPAIPASLADKIAAIRGLNDFRLRPRFTDNGGGKSLAPDDFATIYNLKPLYDKGITGTGQKVVVVGQTRVNLTDLQLFRSTFKLPARDPETILVPSLPDPGISDADLPEALLDIDWAGAVARDASIIYVYSDDVTDALEYAIEKNLAPVISMSYGLCEPELGVGIARYFRALSQRAAAQGITWLAASGDAGAADCYRSTAATEAQMTVDIPASLPEVTGVGGTRFNEGTGTFWNLVNDTAGASAMSYIPETAWNDATGSATGGGASAYFAKPAWQTGTPEDGARDVPDISVTASAQHGGYRIYLNGVARILGGTSASAPAFAGIVALLNQYVAAGGVGNMNPRLYAMAVSVPGAFHDITTGNNIVNPCSPRVTKCSGERIGFNAGVGYDQTTGLGTIDAFNLVTGWGAVDAPKTPVFLTVTSSPATLPLTGTVQLTATVRSSSVGTPSGTVTFFAGSTALGTAPLSGTTATLTVAASQLAGAGALTAKYSGDAGFAELTSNALFLQIGITGAVNAASYKTAAAPGMILAVYGGLLAGKAESAAALPLPTTLGGVTATISGVPCPLYYVSPGQINLQVPGSTLSGPATLSVTYNGQTATAPLVIAPAAPGVFMNFDNNAPVPDEGAKRGQTISLYITGDGATPPEPSVTVGGIPAQLTYFGVPSWSVGVTQINYTVPVNAALGRQPVVVTVGGVSSAPLYLSVTQ